MIPKIYIADTIRTRERGAARRLRTPTATCAVAVFLCLLFGTGPVVAQGSEASSHVVTVVIMERHSILVTGGDITLTIIPPSDGSDPDPVVNNGCDLLWSSNRNNNKRITVESDIVGPAYGLTVQAANITGTGTLGNYVGEADLTVPGAHDFFTNVRKCHAQCDLVYTASSTAADLPGTDVHTVTYTLVR